MIMEIVKRTGILALLMVFLFGITGISIFHHGCTSSSNQQVTVYAEIYRQAPVSCCEGEAFEPFAGHHEGLPQNITATPCCKSTNAFLALHIITERTHKLALQPEAPVLISYTGPAAEPLPEKPGLFHTIRVQFHSPPRFGTELIHFLHQIKIPAHPAIA